MPLNGTHSGSQDQSPEAVEAVTGTAMPPAPAFPTVRMRRNRKSDWSRALIRENVLTVGDLIWPVFVREGTGLREPVDSMPGVVRYSPDTVADAVAEAAALGVPAIALFPFTEPDLKDPVGSVAVQPDNLVCRAIRAVRDAGIEIGVMCDAALDPFTSHGHDGVFDESGTRILNDETVEILCRQSLVQAEAGCDVISPSDMMDGRVGAIRRTLDAHGFDQVQIMAYSAKYASCFYSPFRNAVGSATQLGGASKATYQMDPANGDEALREVALDIAEGADMVMVKPGLPYLDIVRRVKDRFGVPTYAYQVSGEYAMIAAAAGNGWLDRERAMLESLLCFKRAGADGVLSYFAVDVAKRLKAG
jgi:porphobilinogen synthase